jgi:ATP-dependent DNA helicase 2 subunit 1
MMVCPFLLQEEELADGLQLEPPGMHLIYLPYADDIRPTEKAGSQLLTQSEIATDWSLQ